jgi:hypothetical protein
MKIAAVSDIGYSRNFYFKIKENFGVGTQGTRFHAIVIKDNRRQGRRKLTLPGVI